MIRISATLAILLCVALPLRAQDVEPPVDLPPPASLTYVDGDVQYLNAGAAERADAQTMLSDGDGIRTARGRAELVFGDGSVLHLDEHTALDLLSDRRLRLLDGRIVFRASAAAGNDYVIDTPAASIGVDNRGEYNVRVDGRQQSVEVAVARGAAELDLTSERLIVQTGEEARIDRPGDRPLVRTFNSARLDAFERWALTRYEGEALSPSSRRLPTELRAYGQTFDRYGRWGHVAPYGPVWYPSVAVGWRPYYNGGWRHTRYGWTWYGLDPWAWPTHHYGRWHVAAGVWFWIPGRVWAPAWVSWAYAPGYVSWAPLGWNSHPVVPFYIRAGHLHPHRWRAWTVIPRGHLGRRGPIRPWVVDAHRTPRVAKAAFVQQPVPAYAVRREGRAASAVPRRSFDRAVPRNAPSSGRGSVTRDRGIVRGSATRSVPGRGRTFEQQWGGMARPRRSAAPSAQARRQQAEPRRAIRAPSRQVGAESRGAIRRQGARASAPSRPSPAARPRWEGPGPNDVGQARARAGTARGQVRSPRAEPRSRPARSGSSASPRSAGARQAPRVQSAKPRGATSSSSAGRARGSGGGQSRGGGRGGARRPPKG